MREIKYWIDTGLYNNLIECFASSEELPEICAQFSPGKSLNFNPQDGATVDISEGQGASDTTSIEISAEISAAIIATCNRLSAQKFSCHDYIDLPLGYILMISKDEF